jgi:hypothetical protein
MASDDGGDHGGGQDGDTIQSPHQGNLNDACHVATTELSNGEDVDALIERQLLGLDLQVRSFTVTSISLFVKAVF